MNDLDQNEASGRAKLERDHKTQARDDAEQQPESGYPGGRLDTRPSTDEQDEVQRMAELDQTGSESEFDSEKPRA